MATTRVDATILAEARLSWHLSFRLFHQYLRIPAGQSRRRADWQIAAAYTRSWAVSRSLRAPGGRGSMAPIPDIPKTRTMPHAAFGRDERMPQVVGLKASITPSPKANRERSTALSTDDLARSHGRCRCLSGIMTRSFAGKRRVCFLLSTRSSRNHQDSPICRPAA